ncbi:hypothetical protein LXL04_000427 [Taraxacum kok-saghyz]
MGDQSPQNTMNLDLNLGPFVHPSDDDQPDAMTFEDWLLGSMREVTSNRPIAARQRLQSVWRHMPVSMEPTNTTLGLTSHTGSDHNNDNEQPQDMNKTNENGDKLENGIMGDKNHETNNKNEASFFDCNICLDLASDPVVTCCGHLFCWPCLYRWLFIHSDSKECPLCKGQVTMKTITPIYTRGTRPHSQTLDSNLKIPSRPQANRIESWRQSIQRNTLNIPMFEMIRRLDNRFDLSTNPNQSLLNRIFTSRGLRSGQDLVNVAPDVTVDPLPEDRHSVSSIAAVIQSETDSRVSVSTSSRRRCESSTSRVEDVNSGESRSRRRRLQGFWDKMVKYGFGLSCVEMVAMCLRNTLNIPMFEMIPRLYNREGAESSKCRLQWANEEIIIQKKLDFDSPTGVVLMVDEIQFKSLPLVAPRTFKVQYKTSFSIAISFLSKFYIFFMKLFMYTPLNLFLYNINIECLAFRLCISNLASTLNKSIHVKDIMPSFSFCGMHVPPLANIKQHPRSLDSRVCTAKGTRQALGGRQHRPPPDAKVPMPSG